MRPDERELEVEARRGGALRGRARLPARTGGPLSLERLSQLTDGRLSYRMKRPSASGATSLEFTPVEFLRRVAALIPPPRVNLVRFFGVLAPNARLYSLVVPAPQPTLPQEPTPAMSSFQGVRLPVYR